MKQRFWLAKLGLSNVNLGGAIFELDFVYEHVPTTYLVPSLVQPFSSSLKLNPAAIRTAVTAPTWSRSSRSDTQFDERPVEANPHRAQATSSAKDQTYDWTYDWTSAVRGHRVPPTADAA